MVDRELPAKQGQKPHNDGLRIQRDRAHFSASAKHCAAAIRDHWHVENTLHYTRDVTFLEDQSRIRCNPGVFSRLRSFGYNILRRNKVATFSQDSRYAAALRGIDALLKWSYS